MKTKIATLLLVLSLLHYKSQSIAAYAAPDKKTTSDLAYYIAWTCVGETSSKIARENLVKQGYDNNSLKSIGYESLTKGYYTLIKTEFKKTDGTKIISYRFGADSTSMEVSLKKALARMPWNWTAKDGYEIVVQSAFSACDFNSITCTTTTEKGNACGNKIVSFNAKQEHITSKNQVKSSANKKYFQLNESQPEAAVFQFDYLCSPDKKTYSELKFLSAENLEKLEMLIALEAFNTNSEKNLEQIQVKYKTSNLNNQTNDRGIMDSFIKDIRTYLLQKAEEYCKQNPNECEQKKKKYTGIGIRG